MKRYLRYKGIPVNSFGIPILYSKKKNIPGRIKREYSRYRCFDFNFPLTAPRDLVVVYDLPDSKRKERDWLRRHLQKFGYTMIQRSVWVGPSPLPPDFLKYVKSIGLLNQLRTLKLAEPYSKDKLNM